MTDVARIFRITLQVTNVREAARFYARLLGTPGTSIRGSSRHYALDPYGNELCFVEAGTEFTGGGRGA